MNGIVTPVSGITRVTPPMITNACRAMIAVSPVASSFEKPSSASIAGVMERVEPDVEPLLDVADRPGEEPGAEREQREADEDERDPGCRDVDHRQERAEEHQRAAEVADEDEHHHRRAPDDEQRPEVLERRQDDPGELPRADHEHLAA